MAPKESPRPRPRERSHHYEEKRASRSHAKSRHETSSSQSSSQLLSANALAKLNQLNQQQPARVEEVTPQKKRRKRHREIVDEKLVVEKSRKHHKRKKRRVVSGALLEEGESHRLKGLRGGGRYEEYDDGRRKKRLCRLPSKTDNGCRMLILATRDAYWCRSGNYRYYSCSCSGGLQEEIGLIEQQHLKFQS